MPKSSLDKYVNRAFVEVTMSGANTITFDQIRFGVGVFQGVALLLHQVQYHPVGTTLNELAANTDSIVMGLTLRDDLTTLDPTNQAVIDRQNIKGMGAGVEPIRIPVVSEFSQLPGGGILIPSNPLYLAMETGGFVAAGQFRAVLFYTFVSLTDKQSMELLQTIIPGNV